MWKERKEKAFLKCPNCGTMLAVPRGKGKIIVTCPKCHGVWRPSRSGRLGGVAHGESGHDGIALSP